MLLYSRFSLLLYQMFPVDISLVFSLTAALNYSALLSALTLPIHSTNMYSSHDYSLLLYQVVPSWYFIVFFVLLPLPQYHRRNPRFIPDCNFIYTSSKDRRVVDKVSDMILQSSSSDFEVKPESGWNNRVRQGFLIRERLAVAATLDGGMC